MPRDTIGRPGWFLTRTSASGWQEGKMKYEPRQTRVSSPSASRASVNQEKLGARNAGQSNTAPQIAHWPRTYPPSQGRSNTEPALAQNRREPPQYAKAITPRAADSPPIAIQVPRVRGMQQSAARFVMGNYRYTSSVTEMLNSLKWSSISFRVNTYKLQMM